MEWLYKQREDEEHGELIPFKIVGSTGGKELKAHKLIVRMNLNLLSDQDQIDIDEGYTEVEVAAFIKFLYFRNLDHVEDDEEDHTQTLFRKLGLLCVILNVKPELFEFYGKERQRRHDNRRRRQRNLSTALTAEEDLGQQNNGMVGEGNMVIQQEPIDEEMGERNNLDLNQPEETVNEVNQTDRNGPTTSTDVPTCTSGKRRSYSKWEGVLKRKSPPATRVGKLSLHKEQQNHPRNIISALSKREYGIVSERVNDGSLMVRHLISSRPPKDPNPIEIVDKTPIAITYPPPPAAGTGEQGSAQWLRTPLGTSKKKNLGKHKEKKNSPSPSNNHSSRSTKIYAACVDDYIVIHDKNAASRSRLFFTTNPHLSSDVPFRFHFEIPGPYAFPWNFSQAEPYWNYNCVPDEEGRVTESKPRMLLYDTQWGNRMCNYNTGEILMEMNDVDIHGIDIPPSAFRSPAAVSTFEKTEQQTGKIYWYCRRRLEIDPPDNISSIKQRIAIMEYSRFQVTESFVIPMEDSAFSTKEQFVIFAGILITADSTSVHLYDLLDEDDLHPNRSLMKINSADAGEINSTVTLREACEPLFEIETKERRFRILEGIWPPCVLVQGIKSYQIRSMDDPKKIIYELDHTGLYGENLWLRSYDDTNSRVIVSGFPHGIEIIHIDSRAMKSTVLLSTENFKFYSEFDETTVTIPESSSPGQRRSTRPKLRVDYSRVETGNYESFTSVFAYAYSPRLNLLALCKASDGILRIVLVDNSTLRVLKRLQPIKLTVPARSKDNDWECSKLQVHLNETFICVRVRLTNNVKGIHSFQLYTGRLLGELVPDLE